MTICKTAAEMRAHRQRRRAGSRLGFVPTMGALHPGHLSLVRAAREQCDTVAVSVFVNPTQFAPHEDWEQYPRTLARDRELLDQEGVELLFVPSEEEMYPPGASTWVQVDGLSDKLCGRSRPGHFRGVTTVVAKLFHIVQPECAFFGQKDAAQLAIIRRMVRDLHLPVEIVGCPVVREADGLAMSSRNAYLDHEQRQSAPALYRSLMRVEKDFNAGERNAAPLIAAGRGTLSAQPGVRLDYFEIVDPQTLDPLAEVSQPALVAVAAFVGKTRLIDCLALPGSEGAAG
jgi:pantoate--beta-alanine ligase